MTRPSSDPHWFEHEPREPSADVAPVANAQNCARKGPPGARDGLPPSSASRATPLGIEDLATALEHEAAALGQFSLSLDDEDDLSWDEWIRSLPLWWEGDLR